MSKTILVVPCYNEADRIRLSEYDAFLQAGDVQLLFVNDGSTDATATVLDAWCQLHSPMARALHLPKNQGKAEAVRQGLLKALEDNAAMVGYADADQATPVVELRRMIDIFKALPITISVVMGSRIRRLGARIERNTARHYLGRAFATSVSLLLAIPVYDTQCGAKFFRSDATLRAVLSRPFVSRWIFDVELLGRLLGEYRAHPELPKSRFLEIPLEAWRDVKGSKVRSGTFIRAAIDLLRIARELHAARAPAMSDISRIAILHTPYAVRGGEDVCVEHEANALTDAGWRIERFPGAHSRHPRLQAVQALFSAGAEGALERALTSNPPDMVHVHNLFPLYSPKIFRIARRRGIKTVMTLHNFRPLCLNGLYLTPANERCERCSTTNYWPGIVRGCYRKSRVQSAAMALHLRLAAAREWYFDVDLFIAPSEFLKQKYVARGFPADKIAVQGHFLPELPQEKPAEAKPYLLYLGRLSDEKGLRWLIRQFPPSSKVFRLLIAGSGPLESLVKAACGPSIDYLGYLQGETKNRYLREAAALVMPSACYENFPLAVMEANAWGTPAIVSRLGGLEEMVRSGENGASFAVQDADDFQRVLTWLRQTGTLPSTRQACQDHARRCYGRDAFLQRRTQLYAALQQRSVHLASSHERRL